MGTRILVKMISQEVVKGTLLLPNADKEKKKAVVVALGTAKYDKHGNPFDFIVKINDTILIPPHCGVDMKGQHDEADCFLIFHEEILAIIE